MVWLKTALLFPIFEDVIQCQIQSRLHAFLHETHDFSLHDGLLLFLLVFLLLLVAHRIFTSLVKVKCGVSSSAGCAYLIRSRNLSCCSIQFSVADCPLIWYHTQSGTNPCLRANFIKSVMLSSYLTHAVKTPAKSRCGSCRTALAGEFFSVFRSIMYVNQNKWIVHYCPHPLRYKHKPSRWFWRWFHCKSRWFR